MGAYHGKFGFEAFSHRKAILVRPHGLELINALRYTPISDFGYKIFNRALVKTLPKEGLVKFAKLLKFVPFHHAIQFLCLLLSFYAGLNYRK